MKKLQLLPAIMYIRRYLMRARAHTYTRTHTSTKLQSAACNRGYNFSLVPVQIPLPQSPLLFLSLPLHLVLRLKCADRTRVVRFLVLVTDNYRRSSFNPRFFPAAPGHQSHVK